LGHAPQSIKYRLGMELRPRTKVSVSQSRRRATADGRTQLGTNHLFNPVDTRVNSLSSPTGIARGGKARSRTLSPEGGPFRASSPNPRSESAGGAGGSTNGNPPRRRGQNWESGDAGGGSASNRELELAAVIRGRNLHDYQTKVKVQNLHKSFPLSCACAVRCRIGLLKSFVHA